MPATKLQIVGWLHVLVGGVGLGAGAIMISSVVMSTDKASLASVVIVPLVLFFSAVYFGPAFLGGIGVLRRQRWARGLLIALSVVELLAVPVGTVIGAFGLWVLFDRETKALFDASTVRAVSIPPTLAASRFIDERAGVLLAITGVGAGFIVAIGAGFRISGQMAPAGIDALFYPAVVVLALVLMLAVRLIAAHRSRPRTLGAASLGVRRDERHTGRQRVPFDADRR